MPRKPTLTQQTNAQADAAFSAAEKTLGRLLDPFAEGRYAVLVDGIPLGDRQNEIRKPGSSFYDKSFLEAISVAQLAANLGFDREGVVEVLRRPPPRPDIELQVNGITVAFVEQTMVVDEDARKVEVALDELNDAIAKCKDAAVRAVLDVGTLTVRLNSLPAEYYSARLPVDELTKEVYAVVQTLSGATTMKVDGARYPLLGKMDAWAGYMLRGRTNNRVMSLFEHGREQVLPRAFSRPDSKKASKGGKLSTRVSAALVTSRCRFALRGSF